MMTFMQSFRRFLCLSLSASMIASTGFAQGDLQNDLEDVETTVIERKGDATLGKTLVTILGASGAAMLGLSGASKYSANTLNAKAAVLEPQIAQALADLKVAEKYVDSVQAIDPKKVVAELDPRISVPLPENLGFGQDHALYYVEEINDPMWKAQANEYVEEMRSYVNPPRTNDPVVNGNLRETAIRNLNQSALFKDYQAFMQAAREAGVVSRRPIPNFPNWVGDFSDPEAAQRLLLEEEFRYRGFINDAATRTADRSKFVLGIFRELHEEDIEMLKAQQLQAAQEYHKHVTKYFSTNDQAREAYRTKAKSRQALSKRTFVLGGANILAAVGIAYFATSMTEVNLNDDTNLEGVDDHLDYEDANQ